MTWRTVDDVLAWLDEMPPADAVAAARLLADRVTGGALREYADRVVWDATRSATYDEVAAALGLSRKQVMRAVESYRSATA